ncbi:hypothetical protein [Streptomyces sp. NPDC059455]|uniref:hypothetical protein n=1 Tax=Streptomyces sp. NPDC059455 TaxID=3346837 RepID=UPI00367C3CFE
MINPDTDAQIEQQLALIACGSRPGKTKACDCCQKKCRVLLDAASLGAVDLLAAVICGSEHNACGTCKEKAAEIIRVYNETVE